MLQGRYLSQPNKMKNMLPSLETRYQPDSSVQPDIVILEIRPRLVSEYHPDKAIGWLIVERELVCKTHPDTKEITEAAINLFFYQLDSDGCIPSQERGCWSGGYSRDHNRVSLTCSSATSKGAVFMDLPGMQGNRVGTYLMNEIVKWAQQWPTASVNPITLDAAQGYAENKQRRNQFYEQFGLVFDYLDTEKKSGESRPMIAETLKTVDTWKQNITVHQVIPLLRTLFRTAEDNVRELEFKTNAIKRLTNEQREIENHPVRFALRNLWYRFRVPIAIALTCLAAWLGSSVFK